MKAMVLAAGLGTRMGALTDEMPKPLLGLGSESLLERHLRTLARAGFDDIVVNVAHNGDRIRRSIGDGSRWNVRVRYSIEGDAPLETAGGIVHALPLLGAGRFVVVNADVCTDFDFARLRARAGEGAGKLVLVPNPSHNPGGDFGVDAQSRIVDSPPRLTFAGISVLDAALFADLPAGRRPLKPILDAAIARGALLGERYDGLWIDVGTPERLALARETLSTRASARGSGRGSGFSRDS